MKYLGSITSDYDLVNKKYVDDRIQTVPTNISAFTNDAGYTTNTGTITGITGGTGLSGSASSGSVTLNHSNSVTAKTTQALYPIKYDAQGHITGSGTAVTSLPANDVYAWAKASTKPSYTATEVGAVPTSRTINSKALTSNITLTAANVGAVPTNRTVNGKSLSSNISLTSSDLGINDYVIEQTTSGDWTYTKWNSGKAEAWARLAGANSVAFTTSQQSGKFYTNADWIGKQVNLPNGLFSGAPVVTVEVENNGYLNSAVANVAADGSNFTLRCWSVYSKSFNITNISIYAKGKWQ